MQADGARAVPGTGDGIVESDVRTECCGDGGGDEFWRRPVSVLRAHLIGWRRRAGPGPYSCAVTKNTGVRAPPTRRRKSSCLS